MPNTAIPVPCDECDILSSMPSNSISSVESIRSMVPSVVASLPRTAAIVSIPSNKRMAGAARRAASNKRCIACSDAPTSLCIIDVQFTSINLTDGNNSAAYLAQRRAIAVFPLPDSPVSNTAPTIVFVFRCFVVSRSSFSSVNLQSGIMIDAWSAFQAELLLELGKNCSAFKACDVDIPGTFISKRSRAENTRMFT